MLKQLLQGVHLESLIWKKNATSNFRFEIIKFKQLLLMKNSTPTAFNAIYKKGRKKKKKILPPVRFELTTPGLQDQCSATEL